jgi:hypothetical protein
MRSVKIALVAVLTLLVLGVALALAHAPMSVARTNVTAREEDRIAYTTKGATYCQASELLPHGTSAIRLSFLAFAGPRIRVVLSSGGRAITSGERGSGWTSRVVTVPVKPLAHTVSGVTVCASFRLRNVGVTVFGQAAPRAIAATNGEETLPGRMWIEYLRPGPRSWASLAPSIVTHMGFGRAASGTGIALLAIAVLATVAVLASRLVLKELR